MTTCCNVIDLLGRCYILGFELHVTWPYVVGDVTLSCGLVTTACYLNILIMFAVPISSRAAAAAQQATAGIVSPAGSPS